jgi:UDP-glucuronate decarboxylase
MRILVIGGASVVGSHLCDRLLDDGHEVIAVDDFTSGSFATIAHLRTEPRFTFVEHDVTKPFRAHADRIFHLALPSSRRSFDAEPVRATLTGVLGTMHALETSSLHDARIVMMTSAERFGQGVRCAESLAIEVSKAARVDVRTVRVAMTYGPRMAPDTGHVVSRFILAALGGEDLLVPHEIAETAVHLAYVDDTVETLVRTMDSDLRVPAIAAPFVESTVEQIACTILDAVLGDASIASSPPVSGPISLPARYSSVTSPDAIPASLAFGQSSAMSLDEGIARTVRSFQDRIQLLIPAAIPKPRESFLRLREEAPDGVRSDGRPSVSAGVRAIGALQR